MTLDTNMMDQDRFWGIVSQIGWAYRGVQHGRDVLHESLRDPAEARAFINRYNEAVAELRRAVEDRLNTVLPDEQDREALLAHLVGRGRVVQQLAHQDPRRIVSAAWAREWGCFREVLVAAYILALTKPLPTDREVGKKDGKGVKPKKTK